VKIIALTNNPSVKWLVPNGTSIKENGSVKSSPIDRILFPKPKPLNQKLKLPFLSALKNLK
jgi:hypothetical protein